MPSVVTLPDHIVEEQTESNTAAAADVAQVPRLPGIASQVIGERMRAMYGELVREPVPDDLIALIQKLEKKERAS